MSGYVWEIDCNKQLRMYAPGDVAAPFSVTTANGFPLARGATYCDDLGSQVLYCIVAAGTENARVLEQ